MRNVSILIFYIAIIFLFLPSLYGQKLSYDYLIELGKTKLAEKDYSQALHYFRLAQILQPSSQEAMNYINLIKRIYEGRAISEEEIRQLEKEIIARRRKRERVSREEIIKETLSAIEKKFIRAKRRGKEKLMAMLPIVPPKKKKEIVKPEKMIYLKPELREQLPLTVELSPHQYYLLRSENPIKRFLVINPSCVYGERVDEYTVKILGKEYGSTFFHLWDKAGRWTFNIRVKPPLVFVKEKPTWEDVEGFRFTYDNEWSNYYSGRRLGTMERASITFDQNMRVSGLTPYGEMDASLSWSKSGEAEEVTDYTLGLTKGHFLNFSDFTLRGFYFSDSFSPLSFPGVTLKGVLFSSPAFHNNLEYTLLYGKEKWIYFGSLRPGVSKKLDRFIEGLRVSLFPEKNNRFFFNYAHGYGKDRESYLKEKVFSFQTEHKLSSLTFSTEVASDETHIAATALSTLTLPKLTLRLSLRDIEKDFVTITGYPSNPGEIGGTIGFDWKPSDKIYLTSNLNIYRDRLFFNPGNRRGVNYEWDTTFNSSLNEKTDLAGYIRYLNTPGLSSPQRSLNAATTLSHRFNWDFFGPRTISTFLGCNYQRSINPLSPTSDYQLYGLRGGFRLRLIRELFYYLNYQYSWLTELSSKERDHPSVMETGVDFTHSFTPAFSSNLRFYYRDEERASSLHSFLAGEDSIEGSLHFSYKPSEDREFYLDGRVRNVWAENPEVEKYIEAELRMGARLSWESFFKWAPLTTLEVVVFKDVNGNGKRDEGEKGVPDIKVTAGPKEMVTDKEGRCNFSLRLKKVVVSLEPSSLPSGYVLTTPSSLEIDISQGGRKKIQFGISSSAGIFGVVFYDTNGNGKLDKEDVPIPAVKLILDKKKTASTNNEGVYFFGNLSPGSHLLQVDINSLPQEYLPRVPVKKEIEVFEGITYAYYIPLAKR